MQVKETTQDTVYPSTPSPAGKVLELSNNDQIAPRFYTPLLLFFQETPTHQAPALLKSSLAQTLSLFYPLAGRYRESINGELEIVCNDDGAVLQETWVDCGFDHFSPDFDPHPDFALLVPRLDPSADISQLPLLLVQITHFECGGMCLCLMLHHNVCDGISASHFLSSWAILTASSLSEGRNGSSQLIIKPPHLDRSLLRTRNPPSPTAEHPEYQTHMHELPSTWPPRMVKLFHFTPSFVEDLRTQCAGSDGTRRYSRFEALAAHIWRGIIHARGLAPEQDIRLGVAVDGRMRFNPPLPAGYFGNAAFHGFAACKARELVENPVSYGASLVKAAVSKVTDAHMRSFLDWVAQQESPKAVVPAYRRPFIDLVITSWWRFPFYDLDFGWGKPSHVRLPAFEVDGLVVLLPSPLGASHVDALVSLCTEHLRRFEQYIDQCYMTIKDSERIVGEGFHVQKLQKAVGHPLPAKMTMNASIS